MGLALCAALSGAAAARPGASELVDENERLKLFFGEEMVVSVTSAREEPLAETPASIFIITDEDIRVRGYRDLMDVFHDLPGFDVAYGQEGEVATGLVIRGIEATNRIVVLRDGVPITFPAGALFETFGRNMPLYNIKRIEVLYGPASVIYGANAFSAVIQLISKDPTERPRVEASLAGGSPDPQQGFHRHTVDTHLAFRQPIGPVELTAGGRFYDSSGPNLAAAYPKDFRGLDRLPAPNTGRYETPIRAWNVEAALSWKKFQVGIYFTDHSWSSSASQNPNPPISFVFSPEARIHYQFFQAFARHEGSYGPVTMRTLVTYGDRRFLPDTQFYRAGTASHSFAQQQSLRLDHATMWKATRWLTLTGGLRLQTFSVVPRSSRAMPDPYTTDGSLYDEQLDHLLFNRYGGSLLAEAQPLKVLKLSLGITIEHDGNAGETVYLPRGGLVWSFLRDRAHLKLLYGEAYVAASPDLQYLGRFAPKSPNRPTGFLPNPDLKSERIRTVELVYDHRFTQSLQGDLNAYFNQATGLIQDLNIGPTDYAKQTAQWTNVGFLRSYGGEVNLRYSPLRWLQLFGSYAVLYGQQALPALAVGQTEVVDLPKVSHHKVLAGFTMRPFWHTVVDLRLRWVSDISTRPTNVVYKGGSFDGYYDLNLHVLVEDIVPGLDASLLVENLTSNRYYQFAFATESFPGREFTPAAPISFMARLTYRLKR